MDLEQIARQTRSLTVKILKNAGSGHPGGALSMVEIITLLHCETMRPAYPEYHPDKAQDIFILSGGHKYSSLIALWSVLGWVSEESAMGLRSLGSMWQGHPSLQYCPWVWASSGSLGQAAAVGVGYAMAYRRQGLDKRVYVLASEGDANEGIFTEAMRIARHYQLSNLCLIIDANQKQSDRHSLLMVHPEDELRGLGWLVESCDGHSFEQLRALLDLSQKVKSKPMAIVAQTVKSKGVPLWEADPDSMHGSMTLSDEDLEMALEAINGME